MFNSNCSVIERISPKKGCAWGGAAPPSTPFFREFLRLAE